MNNIVESRRIQYTTSKFAKETFLYLQEAGFSKSIKKHTNKRKYLSSFLFMIIIDGNGEFYYQNQRLFMKKGDCAFIDCRKPFSHTSDNWKIAWVHFDGSNIKEIYQKYIDRNGRNVFNPRDFSRYYNLINEIYNIAESDDYLRDMEINNKLYELLLVLMKETIYSDKNNKRNKYDIQKIKEHLDEVYTSNITLDELSSLFFINKFYLTRVFKDNYGTTINNYILEKKITKAKELLRFSNFSIEEIGIRCGINDPNYFSRLFKKVEGITPKEYQKMW